MKSVLKKYMFVFIAFPVGFAFIALTWFFSKSLAFSELVALVAFCFAYALSVSVESTKAVSRLNGISRELNAETSSILKSVPFLCAAFDNEGKIFWFNGSFAADFFENGRSQTLSIERILGMNSLDEVKAGSFRVEPKNGKSYTAYCRVCSGFDEYVLYLIDETHLRRIEKRFYETRPAVMLITIDTTDEIYQNFKESECGTIFGRIEEIIDHWSGKYRAVDRKLSSGRYVVISEEKSLKEMMSDKFKILEQVRNLNYADKKINATLSIGIGQEESLIESDEAARAALDMAQGRGGDQVAIKRGKEYIFFGGLSDGPERSNKVKTRVVANSFSELIESSENVMIMGHRYADLDAFGSAMGVLSIVRYLKKPVNIVIDKPTALATPLIKRFEQAGFGDHLVTPDKARFMVSENTLLVVVDTHKPDFTECPELLSKTKKIVVIDHHRKSVNHIEKAVLFFHASYASSASEMVTELAQYIGNAAFIDSLTAEALLSGIMLDTRNFVMRTGVRTFEAAAYLRSRSADTVEVKKLFSNNLELYKYRNQVIDGAYNYHGCAISVTDIDSPDIRLITSQAADELLNVDGVKASFVIFVINSTVCISTRSFGEMNVQVVMEKFGGGGHRTMAAAQIENETVENVIEKLKKEIDNYFEQ